MHHMRVLILIRRGAIGLLAVGRAAAAGAELALLVLALGCALQVLFDI